ncbi:papain fold toxin 1 (glutamine deamidase) of polymorphic toxin system [Catellatospora citrea]|nr:papain fold toxin 1 (glutamine deamidase) of polymorphic toxin system [Catellatospora citrea]
MSLDLTWQRAGSSWDSVAAVLGEQGPGSMAIVLVDRVNASRHGFLLRNHDDDIIVIETQEAKGGRVRSLADALPPVDARVAVIDATGRQVVLPEMPRDAADALTDSARKGPRYGSLQPYAQLNPPASTQLAGDSESETAKIDGPWATIIDTGSGAATGSPSSSFDGPRRPDFLASLDVAGLDARLSTALLEALDLTKLAGPSAERFSTDSLSEMPNRVRSSIEAPIEDGALQPARLETPGVTHAVWLGRPLLTMDRSPRGMRLNRTLTAAAANKERLVVLWLDVSRAEIEEGSDPDLAALVVWARTAGIRLVSLNEVFHADAPMILESEYRLAANTGKVEILEHIVEMEALFRFGGARMGGFPGTVIDADFGHPGGFAVQDGPDPAILAARGHSLTRSYLDELRTHVRLELSSDRTTQNRYGQAEQAGEGRPGRAILARLERSIVREGAQPLPRMSTSYAATPMSVVASAAAVLVHGLYTRYGDLHLTPIQDEIGRLADPAAAWIEVINAVLFDPMLAASVQTVTDRPTQDTDASSAGLVDLPEEVLARLGLSESDDVDENDTGTEDEDDTGIETERTRLADTSLVLSFELPRDRSIELPLGVVKFPPGQTYNRGRPDRLTADADRVVVTAFSGALIGPATFALADGAKFNVVGIDQVTVMTERPKKESDPQRTASIVQNYYLDEIPPATTARTGTKVRTNPRRPAVSALLTPEDMMPQDGEVSAPSLWSAGFRRLLQVPDLAEPGFDPATSPYAISWITRMVSEATTDVAVISMLKSLETSTGKQPQVKVVAWLGSGTAAAEEATRVADALAGMLQQQLAVGLTRWSQRHEDIPVPAVNVVVMPFESGDFEGYEGNLLAISRGQDVDAVDRHPRFSRRQTTLVRPDELVARLPFDPRAGLAADPAVVMQAARVLFNQAVEQLAMNRTPPDIVVRVGLMRPLAPGERDIVENHIKQLRHQLIDVIASLPAVSPQILDWIVGVPFQSEYVDNGYVELFSVPSRRQMPVLMTARQADFAEQWVDYMNGWRQSNALADSLGWWTHHDAEKDVEQVVRALGAASFQHVDFASDEAVDPVGSGVRRIKVISSPASYDVARIHFDHAPTVISGEAPAVRSAKTVRVFRMRLRLVPRDGVGEDQVNQLKALALKTIEDKVNHRFRLPGGDQFHLMVEFTDHDPHNVVNVIPGMPDELARHVEASDNTWPVSLLGKASGGETILHEVFHLLGLVDEYVSRRNDASKESFVSPIRRPVGAPPGDSVGRAPRRTDNPALMGSANSANPIAGAIAVRYLVLIWILQESYVRAPEIRYERGSGMVLPHPIDIALGARSAPAHGHLRMLKNFADQMRGAVDFATRSDGPGRRLVIQIRRPGGRPGQRQAEAVREALDRMVQVSLAGSNLPADAVDTEIVPDHALEEGRLSVGVVTRPLTLQDTTLSQPTPAAVDATSDTVRAYVLSAIRGDVSLAGAGDWAATDHAVAQLPTPDQPSSSALQLLETYAQDRGPDVQAKLVRARLFDVHAALDGAAPGARGLVVLRGAGRVVGAVLNVVRTQGGVEYRDAFHETTVRPPDETAMVEFISTGTVVTIVDGRDPQAEVPDGASVMTRWLTGARAGWSWTRPRPLRTAEGAVHSFREATAGGADHLELTELRAKVLAAVAAWQAAEHTDGIRASPDPGAVSVPELVRAVDSAYRLAVRTMRTSFASPEEGQPYEETLPMSVAAFIGADGGFEDVTENDGTSYGSRSHHRAAYAEVRRLGVAPTEAAVRVAMMHDYIEKASARLAGVHATARGNVGPPTLGVLTLPEGFFKRPGVPFTEVDREFILAELQWHSAARPHLLIVPGTMVWIGESPDGRPTLNHSAFAVLNGRLVHEVHKLYPTDEFVGYGGAWADAAELGARPVPSTAVSAEASAQLARAKVAEDFTLMFREGNASREDAAGLAGSSAFAVGKMLFTLEISRDHAMGRAVAELAAGRAPKVDGVRRNVADVRLILSRDGGSQEGPLPGTTIRNDGRLGALRPHVLDHRRQGAKRTIAYTAANGEPRDTYASDATGFIDDFLLSPAKVVEPPSASGGQPIDPGAQHPSARPSRDGEDGMARARTAVSPGVEGLDRALPPGLVGMVPVGGAHEGRRAGRGAGPGRTGVRADEGSGDTRRSSPGSDLASLEQDLSGFLDPTESDILDCVPRLDAVVSHYVRKAPAGDRGGARWRARDDSVIGSARSQDAVAMSLDLTWQRSGSSWDAVIKALEDQGPGSMAVVLVDRVNAARHGFLLRNHHGNIVVIEPQRAQGSRVDLMTGALPPVNARVAVIDPTGRQITLPDAPTAPTAFEVLADPPTTVRYGSHRPHPRTVPLTPSAPAAADESPAPSLDAEGAQTSSHESDEGAAAQSSGFAVRSNFLVGLDVARLDTRQSSALLEALDLTSQATPRAEMFSPERLAERANWLRSSVDVPGEDVDGPPLHLDIPAIVHAAWLDRDLLALNRTEHGEFLKRSLAEAAADKDRLVVLWTDVSRAEIAAGGDPDVAALAAWARAAGVRLVNINEVFHDAAPMNLHAEYHLASDAASVRIAEQVVEMEALYRFGGVRMGAHGGSVPDEDFHQSEAIAVKDGDDPGILAARGHPMVGHYLGLLYAYIRRAWDPDPAPGRYDHLYDVEEGRWSRTIVWYLSRSKMTPGGGLIPALPDSSMLPPVPTPTLSIAGVAASLVYDLYARDGDLHLSAVAPTIERLPDVDGAWTEVINAILVDPVLAARVRTATYREGVLPQGVLDRLGLAAPVSGEAPVMSADGELTRPTNTRHNVLAAVSPGKIAEMPFGVVQLNPSLSFAQETPGGSRPATGWILAEASSGVPGERSSYTLSDRARFEVVRRDRVTTMTEIARGDADPVRTAVVAQNYHLREIDPSLPVQKAPVATLEESPPARSASFTVEDLENSAGEPSPPAALWSSGFRQLLQIPDLDHADFDVAANAYAITWVTRIVAEATSDAAMTLFAAPTEGRRPQLEVVAWFGPDPMGRTKAERVAGVLAGVLQRQLAVGLTHWSQRHLDAPVPKVEVAVGEYLPGDVEGYDGHLLAVSRGRDVSIVDRPGRERQGTVLLRPEELVASVPLDPTTMSLSLDPVVVTRAAHMLRIQATERLRADRVMPRLWTRVALPRGTIYDFETEDRVAGLLKDALVDAVEGMLGVDPAIHEWILRVPIHTELVEASGTGSHILELYSIEPPERNPVTAPRRPGEFSQQWVDYLNPWLRSTALAGDEGWWTLQSPTRNVEDIVRALAPSSLRKVTFDAIEAFERTGNGMRMVLPSDAQPTYDVVRIVFDDTAARSDVEADLPTARTVRVFLLRLQLVPGEGVGDEQVERMKSMALTAVDEMLNYRFKLPGGDQFHLMVEFTDREPHRVINVPLLQKVDEGHSANVATWPVGLLDVPHGGPVTLHEMLHLLGTVDEYLTTRMDGVAEQDVWPFRQSVVDVPPDSAGRVHRRTASPALMGATDGPDFHEIAVRYLVLIGNVQESYGQAPVVRYDSVARAVVPQPLEVGLGAPRALGHEHLRRLRAFADEMRATVDFAARSPDPGRRLIIRIGHPVGEHGRQQALAVRDELRRMVAVSLADRNQTTEEIVYQVVHDPSPENGAVSVHVATQPLVEVDAAAVGTSSAKFPWLAAVRHEFPGDVQRTRVMSAIRADGQLAVDDNPQGPAASPLSPGPSETPAVLLERYARGRGPDPRAQLVRARLADVRAAFDNAEVGARGIVVLRGAGHAVGAVLNVVRHADGTVLLDVSRALVVSPTDDQAVVQFIATGAPEVHVDHADPVTTSSRRWSSVLDAWLGSSRDDASPQRSSTLRRVDKSVRSFHAAVGGGVGFMELSERHARVRAAIKAWQASAHVGAGGVPQDGSPVSASELTRAVDSAYREAARKLGKRYARRGGGNAYKTTLAVSVGALIDDDGSFLDADGSGAGSRSHYNSTQPRINPARHWAGSELVIRLIMLHDHLSAASADLQKKLADPGSGITAPVLGVFTLPEGFFKQPDTPFTDTDRELFLYTVLRHSNAFPGLLIVPGTMVWAGESPDGRPTLNHSAVAVLDGRVVHEVHKLYPADEFVGYGGAWPAAEELGAAPVPDPTMLSTALQTASLQVVAATTASTEDDGAILSTGATAAESSPAAAAAADGMAAVELQVWAVEAVAAGNDALAAAQAADEAMVKLAGAMEAPDLAENAAKSGAVARADAADGARVAEDLTLRFRAGSVSREDADGLAGSSAFAVGDMLFTLEISRDHTMGRAAAELAAGRAPEIGGVRRDVADVRIILSRDGGLTQPSLPGTTIINDGKLAAVRPQVIDYQRGARRIVANRDGAGNEELAGYDTGAQVAFNLVAFGQASHAAESEQHRPDEVASGQPMTASPAAASVGKKVASGSASETSTTARGTGALPAGSAGLVPGGSGRVLPRDAPSGTQRVVLPRASLALVPGGPSRSAQVSSTPVPARTTSAMGEQAPGAVDVHDVLSGGQEVRDLTDPDVAPTASELIDWVVRESTVPVSLEDGIGESQRTWGVEVEFALPPELSERERHVRMLRIVQDLNRFGLTRQAGLLPHGAARASGYSRQRADWRLELESGDDGEIVSPTMPYKRDPADPATPSEWADLALVVAIVRRHGGVANHRVSVQVHVGFDRNASLASVVALLGAVTGHQDALFRLAATPGGYLRSLVWTEPLVTPSAGYDAAAVESLIATSMRTKALSLEYLREGHVEFRLWNNDLDVGVIQTRVRLSRAIADWAGQATTLTAVPESRPLGGSIRSGQDSGAYPQALMDFLPPEAEQLRAQVAVLWQQTRWQPVLPVGAYGEGGLLWVGDPGPGSMKATLEPMAVASRRNMIVVTAPRLSITDDGVRDEGADRTKPLRELLRNLGAAAPDCLVVVTVTDLDLTELQLLAADLRYMPMLVRPVPAQTMGSMGRVTTRGDGIHHAAGWELLRLTPQERDRRGLGQLLNSSSLLPVLERVLGRRL